MDWLSPVLDIATRLCVCCCGHMGYIANLKENLAELKEELNKLNGIIIDVGNKVVAAEQEPRVRRTEAAEEWLTRAKRTMSVLNGVVVDGDRELQNRCFGNFCPLRPISNYKVGRRIVEKLKTATDLIREGHRFYEYSALAVKMPRMRLLSPEFLVEKTVGLDPRVERVWRCIENENTRVIRLCGIGGVGKSTLLKKVSNEFHNQKHDFDFVIWVKVSKQEDYIEKAQEVIRKKLDISDAMWNECSSEDEKMAQISSVLKSKKFALLLDDVWEWFDLLRLGIHLQSDCPDPRGLIFCKESDYRNRSKVIFTTRSVELGNAMEAQETIEVDCLPPDQALTLFRMTVGENILNNDPDAELSKLAEIIATSCGGLPLALLTVGRAMASRRNPREWRHAVELLQSNPSEIDGMGAHVFPLLKFSYDSLNNATAQNCFTYCSIFPKDYNISIDELIDLWIGEGYLDSSNPRNQAEFIVGTLKLAYLLENDESKQCVRMHDTVHDMALWLARDQGKNKNKVLVTKSGTVTYQELKKWEGANWISLWGSTSRMKIDYSPSCNYLSSLLLRDTLLESFPSGFFGSMPALKVLDLSGNQSLVELPSDIGNAKTLQYVNLSLTNIAKLPSGLMNLRNLRCLLLDYTANLKRIPKEVISSLLLLQVYSKIDGVLEYFDPVQVPADDEVAFLEALECLNHINKICITIFAAPSVDKILKSFILRSCITKLTFMDCNSLISLCFTQELGNLERLEIYRCCSLKEFKLSECCKLGNLCQVYIGVCPLLLNLNFLAYAKNLETLTIIDCESLEVVMSEIIAFPGLKTISLTRLRNLKSICPSPRCFPSLSEIEVSQCSLLRQLPFDKETANFLQKIRGETEWWDGLIWDDESVKDACRSKFVSTLSGPLRKEKAQASTSSFNMSDSKTSQTGGVGKTQTRNLPSWMSSRENETKSHGNKSNDAEGHGQGHGPSSSNTKFSKLMEGVVFVLSGFVNPERSTLRSQALAMGAEYQRDWNSNCSLLVCAFQNTPKFRQVKADCGTIVSKEWILECYAQKKIVDIDPYLMHAGKPWRRSSIPHETSEEQKGSSSTKSYKQVERTQSKTTSVPSKVGFDYDESYARPIDKELVVVPDGPITRSRAKKIKEAMAGLVQSTWTELVHSPSKAST